MVKKIVLPVISILLFSYLGVNAQEAEPKETFKSKHQAGIRLGVWSNLGDTHPEGDTYESGFSFKTNINDASFYFEGYFDYRLSRYFMGGLSIGIVNRGSVTLALGSATDIGNILVYPMLLNLKFYPLASMNLKFQPYLTVGGGLYYGRRNVQLTTSYYYSEFEEESSTKFNYSLGGGFDWPIAHSIGLDLNIRYLPIEFSDDLVAVSDYSAFTIAVGIKYLYSSGKK